jgi:hypothetical protein
MGWQELEAQAVDDNRKDRERWVGAYIGVLAVLLAICSMGGTNATTEATINSVKTANMWAFFQAKNIRRTGFSLQIEELELLLKVHPGMPADVKADIEKKIATHKATVQLFTTDPVRKEGLDELFVKARELEAERDVALRKNPYFDFGTACLQIGIVLASVALIAGGWPLILSSFLISGVGTALMLNGFFLFGAMPGIE